MALIKCPECGKEVSDKANICINCGYPISELRIAPEDEKTVNDEERIKEQYWCRRCYKQNKIGEDYCVYCGNKLTPYYKREELTINREKDNFKGIYKYTFTGVKQEVRCPRCGSEDCSHYKEQEIIPEKTKTRYTVNLNPLRPFTFANKKEKTVRQERVVTINRYMCNSCGKIFD